MPEMTKTPAMFNAGSVNTQATDTGAPSGPGSSRETPNPYENDEREIKFSDNFDDVKLDDPKRRNEDDLDSAIDDKPIVPSKRGAIDPTKTNPNRDALDPTKPEGLPHGPAKKEPKFDVEEVTKARAKEAAAEAAKEPSAQPKRDYSQFDPEIAEILNKLPNHLFDKASKLLPEWHGAKKEVETLRQQLKDRPPETVQYWYDNPEAYQLTKEYRESSEMLTKATREQAHWKAQLQAIKTGSSWYELQGYKQDGSPVIVEHKPRDDGRVDAEAEAEILGILAEYPTHINKFRGTLQQTRQQFADSVKRGPDEIKDAETKLFPRWADPAKLSKEDTEAVDLVKSLYPRHMQSHPAVKHAGMTFREFQRLGTMYQELFSKHTKMEKELAQLKQRMSIPVPTDDADVVEDGDEVLDLKKLATQFSGR